MSSFTAISVLTQFPLTFYVRVTSYGTLEIVPKAKKDAVRCRKIEIQLEYPTYEEEQQIRDISVRLRARDQSLEFDSQKFTEERVARCLVQWNLPESLPELGVKPLIRVNRRLSDESLLFWKKLPPLLRKEIANLVHRSLGFE